MNNALLLYSCTSSGTSPPSPIAVCSVSANSGSNIGHTAIAHFLIISVEYFAQACFLEMPIN